MARKRLIPFDGNWGAESDDPASVAAQAPGRLPGACAPIARVAGETATQAALDEVAATLTRVRDEGRMVVDLPLDAVDPGHQSRDRLAVDPEALAELKDSIRARGQQAPVEVVDLGQGHYGLISGWRRLRALQDLAAETGDARFTRVLALIRRPKDRAEAYVAMVEENEIRADLSFFERARIVRQSLDDGVFDSEKQALQSLFSTVSYGKRSKIKSFLPVVDELGYALRFPARVSERLGLALSAVLVADRDAGERIRSALEAAAPDSAEAEAKLLAAAMAPPPRPAPAPTAPPASEPLPDPEMPDPWLIAPGIRIAARRGRVELEGEGVNPGLIDRLQTWLRGQG